MTTMAVPSGIALYGAPDSEVGSKDARHSPTQAMQLELTHDLVDELLESVRSGKLPQILFGRTPVRVSRFHQAALPLLHAPVLVSVVVMLLRTRNEEP